MGFFWDRVRNEPTNEMQQEFREINDSLNEIGLTSYTEEGENLRKVMAVEILSRKFPFIKNYQKDLFIKQADEETKQILHNARPLIGGKK